MVPIEKLTFSLLVGMVYFPTKINGLPIHEVIIPTFKRSDAAK